jgi:heptaprenylglyceryl phosphate synthase
VVIHAAPVIWAHDLVNRLNTAATTTWAHPIPRAREAVAAVYPVEELQPN